MPEGSALAALVRAMEPVLNPGVFVFASVAADSRTDLSAAIATIREAEGTSVVLAEADATRLGVPGSFRCRWITLKVNSSLDAAGLTAAFSTCLGAAGIPCNVVAGMHHDHLFVPVERADDAMRALRSLQASAGTARYSYAWEFLVPPESQVAFERHYGPDGGWVALFRRAPGFIESVLLKDRATLGRYLTVDRWRSEADYRAFRAAYSLEYSQMDQQGELLTTNERAIGEYDE